MNEKWKRLREEHKQALAELRTLPKGFNPLPYIFWLARCQFWKLAALLALIAAIVAVWGSSIVWRNDHFKIVKQKMQLEQLLQKNKIKVQFEKE